MSTAQSMQAVHIGRPRKFQDPEAFQSAIDAYFADRDAQEKPYTMHGLARALDCGRTTLLNYEEYDDAEPFVRAIKRARERVAEWTEDRLHTKGFHPAGAIFSLKNNFGWQDVQRYEVDSRSVVLGVQLSEDERRAYVPQIPSNNEVRPPLGIDTSSERTFASDASLSPVPVNSYPVEK